MAADEQARQAARRMARLSRLALAADAEERAAARLRGVLESFRVIGPLAPAPADLLAPAGPDRLRPDEPAAGLGQERALALAPAAHEGHFRVPAVL